MMSLRDRVRAEIAASGLSQSQASKEAGIESSGGSKLNQWLQEKYNGDNDKIEQQLTLWLDTRKEAQLQRAEMPTAPDWVVTPTAEKIIDTLTYARLAAVSVCVYGGAGVGKTSTCNAFSEQYPNVFIVTASPSAASYPACLRRLATAIGLRTLSHRTDDLEQEVINRLKGTRGLLIIDEAQLLSIDALWGIKGIFDMAKIGVAYIGSQQLYCNLSGGSNEFKAPISRRISKKQALKQSSRADVAALLAAWGVALEGPGGKALVNYCGTIAAKSGALGLLTETLRYAAMLAMAAGSALNLALITKAHQELGGE